MPYQSRNVILLVFSDIIKENGVIAVLGASQNIRYLLNHLILCVYPNSVKLSDVISTSNQS